VIVESIVWLCQRVGPLLTAKHVTDKILLSLKEGFRVAESFKELGKTIGAFPSEICLTAQKRNPKKCFPLSVAICDRKHANRIPRPKVGVSLVV